QVHLVSSLPEKDVKLMRMLPAHSIEDVVATTHAKAGYIMPRGAAVLPLVWSSDWVAHARADA
ncbi:MAG: hypothetical protein LC775_15555, partial [Acidobacteria bacterium]|nr:hypothetical protein [Acidobacteriota bacterium]